MPLAHTHQKLICTHICMHGQAQLYGEHNNCMHPHACFWCKRNAKITYTHIYACIYLAQPHCKDSDIIFFRHALAQAQCSHSMHASGQVLLCILHAHISRHMLLAHSHCNNNLCMWVHAPHISTCLALAQTHCANNICTHAEATSWGGLKAGSTIIITHHILCHHHICCWCTASSCSFLPVSG